MLEIGVLGAGNVGGTLGRRWARAGHKVIFGVRDPNEKRLLLDSRGVEVPTASNATCVMLSSLKSFFFNSLKNES
jgi:8-hydroxy-5-deazaflavin:NADPH oxidoreductase